MKTTKIKNAGNYDRFMKTLPIINQEDNISDYKKSCLILTNVQVQGLIDENAHFQVKIKFLHEYLDK